ncbi:MAG: DUF1800 domain-containing protein [Phycisphaerales bacterium]|nr:DUF1800 domain-containing protein [Phycisphaerales bacterium]
MNDMEVPANEGLSVLESTGPLEQRESESPAEEKTTRRSMLRGSALMALLWGTDAYGQVAQPGMQEQLPIDHLDIDIVQRRCAVQVGGPSRAHRLVDKATFGFTKAELARVQTLGYNNWLTEQLDPNNVPGWAQFEADLATVQHPTHNYGPYLTLDDLPGGQLCFENSTDVRRELVRARIIRACYSPAQLFERAVEFFTDHLNVDQRASNQISILKTLEDSWAIRAHALGNLKDIILASAKSPAMLLYLNGQENTSSAVNENYARELCELHTLGDGNCYDQATIEVLARALTGWRTDTSGANCGIVSFVPGNHDDSTKTVIFPNCPGGPVQFIIPGGLGANEIDEVVDILTNPAKLGVETAKFVGRKLAIHFSRYDPPQALVNAAVNAYVANYGNNDIAAMIKVILSQKWINCSRDKVKRPIHLLASTIRALDGSVSDPGIESQSSRMVGGFLSPAGHLPYQWPTPDGYNDTAEYWSALFPRWDFGAALTNNEYNGVHLNDIIAALAPHNTAQDTIDALDDCMFDGFMDPDDKTAILGYFGGGGPPFGDPEKRLMIGLVIGSPSFQCY